MKRNISRILSILLVVSMLMAIPVFSATYYTLKIEITGPQYTSAHVKTGTDGTAKAGFEMLGAGDSFNTSLGQAFALIYDDTNDATDGHYNSDGFTGATGGADNVNTVFKYSELHTTVYSVLKDTLGQNGTEWATLTSTGTLTRAGGTMTITVPDASDKATLGAESTVGGVYGAEADHQVVFKMDRNGFVDTHTAYYDTYYITVTIEAKNYGGGGSTTPTQPTDSTTLPVSGENTVPVNADINDGTATIPNITDEQVEQAGATQDSGIVVDASGVEGVQTVELSGDAMETIKDSGLDLEIKLPNATLTIDSETLDGTTGGVTVTVSEYDDPSDIDDDDFTEADEEAINGFGPSNIIVYNGNTGANLGLPDDGNTYYVYDPETQTFTRVDNNVPVEDGTIIVARPTDYTGATADKLITDVHDLYLKGYPDGSVKPMGNITRAEVSMAFYRLLKDKSVTGTVSYTDVKADAWYAEAVNALSSIGIIKGYEDGSFKPNQPITRAEFAAVATRFIEAKGGNVKFKDVADDFWAKENISTAAYFGWINGYEDATFRPNNKITRAEAATIINHMLGRNADKSFADGNRSALKQFTDLKDSSKWYYYDMVEATNSHNFTVSDSKETWSGLR